MFELAEAWEERLKRDLGGFADRGIAPVVEREENTLRADWVTRGRTQSEMFGLNPQGVLRWVSSPSGDESYETFLQSEGMADFAQLAEATVRAVPRNPNFVPNDAVVDAGGDDTAEFSAPPATLAELADRGRMQAEGRTNLFFLKGDPGAGKTTLLRETTAFQAQRYLDCGERSSSDCRRFVRPE
jgi:predicted NACHT family NTPase